MKRFSSFMALTAIILTISLFMIPQEKAFAEVADGTYKVNYEMKEAGSDSTSIADGYFNKPATLTVKNGVQHIQLTVTSSDMIKSLSVAGSPVDVVSESGDTRTVKFKVGGDLSQPVDMDMHIVVPDLYDTNHTARAVFDTSGLKSAGSAATKEESSDDNDTTTAAGSNDSSDSNEATSSDDEAAVGTDKAEENPPTGDSTPIALYAMLLLASGVGIFIVFKRRVAQN